MTQPRNSKKSSPARAFTLLELVIVVAIIATLIALTISTYPRIFDYALKVRCMSNLRSLHHVFTLYLADNEHWPQPPEGQEDSAWWITALEPYGGEKKLWFCPKLQRMFSDAPPSQQPAIHYLPTLFDSNPLTPHKWSTMPWLMEFADAHGDGPLILFANGAIKSANEFFSQ
ncbi:MAG: type II secretion system GspH family protein [Chthoniobacterales bacterium]|nr:type II secretion system GspH family protein [Chthoniobacterales bacterium]